jgi:autotransporter-associated beta strand protein
MLLAGCALTLPHLSGSARAAVITWTGAVDGNWSTSTAPTNWNPNIPANNDSAVFDDSGANITNTDDIAGLSLSGVTFNGTTNSYILNAAPSTSLTLSGGATAMVNNSTQIQTVNIPLNFGAATTFTGGSSGSAALKLNGTINNTTTTGNTTLSFSGNGVMTDSLTSAGGGTTITVPNAADSWTIVDNATSTPITLSNTSLVTGSGVLNFGTATSAPNLTISSTNSTAGDHTIGPDPGAVGALNVVNGTLLLKTRINTKNGNITVSGGDLQDWGQIQMANSAVTEKSILTVTGGLLEVRNSSGSSSTGSALFVASRGAGTLTISGGNITCATLDLSRSAAPAVSGVSSQGVLNLNGGTILTTLVTTASANTSGTGAGAAATLNFNGGTLKARSSPTGALFIRDSQTAGTTVPLSVFAKSGGAILDPNSFTIGTAESIQHDPTLGATPDGGLTVVTSNATPGSMALNGLNTYTGPTTVKTGTLFLNSSTSNNNIASSSSIIVGDTAAHSAALLNVAGITLGFQLASGQTLGGYGKITGAVSALAGSFVSPGDSIGTLTENTSMALAGTLDIDVNDADPGINDVLSDTGNLDISAATSAVTFNITGTPSAPAYIFAKYGTLTGSAFGVVNNLPSGYSIDYNYQGNNDIALVTATPEPGIGVLAVTGLLGSAVRRRRK